MVERCVSACVFYMFRNRGVCVQSEPTGVLWQVSGVRVDQHSSSSIPLSHPDLLSKSDVAPDTNHHHRPNHRHPAAPQPIEILLSAVVGINYSSL